MFIVLFFFSSRRRHTSCALVTGVQTCALPILSAFLAHCREEEPEIEIRLAEVPLAEQLRGLRSGDFTIGFAHTAEVGEEILAEQIWHDPLILAVPARHPLLAYKEVPLSALASYPLVLCDPQVCEGYCRELTRLLRRLEREHKGGETDIPVAMLP